MKKILAICLILIAGMATGCEKETQTITPTPNSNSPRVLAAKGIVGEKTKVKAYSYATNTPSKVDTFTPNYFNIKLLEDSSLTVNDRNLRLYEVKNNFHYFKNDLGILAEIYISPSYDSFYFHETVFNQSTFTEYQHHYYWKKP